MAQFVTTPHEDGGCTVAVSGELDIADVDALLAAGRSCLDGGASRVDVDLGETTFIDSSGLGALVRLRNEAVEQGGAVTLSRVPRPVARLLEVTGLIEIFPLPAEG